MISAEHIANPYPASGLAVSGPSQTTIELVSSAGVGTYAEIGVYEGATTLAVAGALRGRGEMHLFDYEDKLLPVAATLRAAGHENFVLHPNTRKIMDSYNWSLMRLLRESPQQRFDYVYLDGAHTWALDALAFFLIDRLLVPGGHVEFDDYHWTIERSPSMNPAVFPPTNRLYTDEQIAERQVALVVDLLVRTHGAYEEVVPDRVFRKAVT